MVIIHILFLQVSQLCYSDAATMSLRLQKPPQLCLRGNFDYALLLSRFFCRPCNAPSFNSIPCTLSLSASTYPYHGKLSIRMQGVLLLLTQVHSLIRSPTLP